MREWSTTRDYLTDRELWVGYIFSAVITAAYVVWLWATGNLSTGYFLETWEERGIYEHNFWMFFLVFIPIVFLVSGGVLTFLFLSIAYPCWFIGYLLDRASIAYGRAVYCAVVTAACSVWLWVGDLKGSGWLGFVVVVLLILHSVLLLLYGTFSIRGYFVDKRQKRRWREQGLY